MTVSLCPCLSNKTYQTCCKPFHDGVAFPKTAIELMRSRYSAYVLQLTDYLVLSTHPDKQNRGLKESILQSMKDTQWINLKILKSSLGLEIDKIGKVEFQADYINSNNHETLHEISRFKRHKSNWVYYDGIIMNNP
ncbi:MAG: hypothetical protein A2Y40_05165 [Candidatus Margulisbacteria bacterium GWF2_35_9]|nr:MAG: hypothetical protein A2Y40_05165 [Candidatus Margulisbacteria bacterium GWF2_35_9]